MITTSPIPNFGRAWSLTVSSPPSSNGTTTDATIAWTDNYPEALRITFEVDITGFSTHSTFWYAKIEIYNLSKAQAIQFIYGQGSTVVLSAGYQTPGAGIIFAGVVYQAQYERPDVINSKVTLLCYTGLKETVANFAQFRGTRRMTQAALIAKMCAGSSTPIPISAGTQTALQSPELQGTALPRARAFFGNPNKFIDGVAAANNMQSWYGSDGVSISNMAQDNSVSTITYTPDNGILGVPQQTMDGVSFRVLLDPRLRVQTPPMQVDISSSIVRQMAYTFPNYPPILDGAGLYLVNGVQHRGDSRGNLWESEIIAMTSIGGRAAYVYELTNGTGPMLDRRSAR